MTKAGSSGTTGVGAGRLVSRLCTMTQRIQVIASSPFWFSAVERTQTTPLLPLLFSLSPMTVDSADRVSPE